MGWAASVCGDDILKTIRGQEGSGGFVCIPMDSTWATVSCEKFDLWQGGENLEVVEPERLVYTFKWEENPGLSANVETVVTVTFEEHDGKTTMNFRQAFFVTDKRPRWACSGMEQQLRQAG